MENLINTIRLIRSKNVGNITFFELIKYFGSAKTALETLPNFIKLPSGKKFEISSKEDAEKEIEECKKLGIDIITYQDFHYPTLLQQVEDKPPILFAKGNLNLLACLPLAVVGSRKASLNGATIATKLVKQLSELNVLIVSGMAAGIDACAHKASLDIGTIAFLGNGVDIIFPPQNKALYYEIINKGLVLSALPPHAEPLACNFPRRNNYIAGMSLGTLVIEAKLNSGSMLTAYSSMNYGREVFAVPGNPNDNNSQGCNKLIKEGAILVESVNDMLDIINKWRSDMIQLREEQESFTYNNFNHLSYSQVKEIESIKKKLLSILTHTPVSIDLIKQEFNSDSTILPLIILELELVGKVIRIPGNKIKLINLEDTIN